MKREEYLQKALEGIEQKRLYKRLYKELNDHIEDRIEYYMDCGYDYSTAEMLSLQKMGNPEDCSNEMRKVHPPLKPWAKVMIAFLVLILFFKAITFPVTGTYTLYGKMFMNQHYVCGIALEDMGNYDSYKYQYHHWNGAFFTAMTSVVTVSYSKNNYVSQIKYIEDNVEFLPNVLVNHDFGEEQKIQIDNDYMQNGWRIRLINSRPVRSYGEYDNNYYDSYSPEDENAFHLYEDYPKHIEIIGTNDEECKIVYLDFEDGDLDSVDSINELLDSYAGYKFK